MQPFFFGKSVSPMYGVVHEPNGGHTHSSAVLICNPLGHEYIRSHFAVRRLAESLAAQGFYVLRFDYGGTGDSAGDFSSLMLAGMRHDINLATEELRALSGKQKVIVIGLRLGSLLAYQASSECRFSGIVLWDPVLNGAQYLDDLRTLQTELLACSFYYSRPRSWSDTVANELLGYVYSNKLVEELMSSRLLDLPVPETSVSYVVSSSMLDSTQIPAKHLTSSQPEMIPDMGDWGSIMKIEQLLSARLIERFITDRVLSYA